MIARSETPAWAAEVAGYPYQDLIEKLAEMALGRSRKTS